ncbi:DUF6931 family protein [Photobacterium galatheae]|uniref:Twin-arginine translocation pathway signal n=1 Tax=Photobacterium galatheae TaxID=1654360 RepID=A0A066RJ29_9GAMM|nr:hypothetical protein [Photobacterium galatheae]KDM90329.1 hypothetical protein EA58_17695 [Photobacterium galatheae]MCM0150790.1 Twin-arginine translocation pathway signal [Photobacterium galatheae]
MTLRKIPYQSAKDIVAFYSPTPPFSQLAAENTSPRELIGMAMAQEMFADAVTFLAHALPVRESVWWAACCAATRTDWNEDEANAVRAAKAWVHTPDETSRRHAEQMAELAGLESGAGWAAQSAFWSGGSMTKPNDPVMPPPPYLYAQAVAGCINLSAVLPDGEAAKQRYRDFIDMGLNIAAGGNGEHEVS